MSVIYGIDLGTTYTKCAAVIDGRVHVVDLVGQEDEYASHSASRWPGSSLRSSVVLETEGGDRKIARVGYVRPEAFDPSRTCRVFEETKAAIGKQQDRVARIDDPPPWHWTPHGFSYRPEDVASFVLRKVAQRAREMGLPVLERIVLTHPHGFGEAQRLATCNAAKLAGLEVVETMREPDAAARAYGKSDSGLHLVFDLGGGTLDINVSEMGGEGHFQTRATQGVLVGGRDFDRELLDEVVREFASKTGLSVDQIRDYLTARRDLKLSWLRRVERMKWRLSSGSSDVVGERFELLREGKPPLEARVQLALGRVKDLTAGLVARCANGVRQALAKANISRDRLSGVLAVGGASAFPPIREMLRQETGGARLFENIDSTVAVALGAAYRGNDLLGGAVPASGGATPSAYSSVLGQSLGILIGTEGSDKVFTLIPTNARCPVEVTEVFPLETSEQPETRLQLYEGQGAEYGALESPKACIEAGDFRLKHLPGASGDEVSVRISVAANGARTLWAQTRGRTIEHAFEYSKETVLPEAEITERRRFLMQVSVV